MKISLGLTTSMPFTRGLKLAKMAENRGYYRIFVGEDITSREVFTYLSLLAGSTDLPLASGVVSIYARGIVSIATATAGLLQLTDFALGIGVGGFPEVKKLTGRTPKNMLIGMREATHSLRKILSGERTTLKGRVICLRNYKPAIKSKVPEIYFGVRGEKMLKLAGELADGVIFSGPKKYLRWALQTFKKSAEKHSRDPRNLKKILWNPLLEEDSTTRVVAATMLLSMPEKALNISNLQRDAEEVKEALIEGGYPLAGEVLSERALREICLSSPEEAEKMGFEEFVYTPVTGELIL